MNQKDMRKLHKKPCFPMGSKFDFYDRIPKICEIFPLHHPRQGRKRGKNGLFRGVFSIKMHFYFTDTQQVEEKMRKKLKKVRRVCCMCGKNSIFAIPNDDDMRGTERGVVNRGMFIERMKECSKYSS